MAENATDLKEYLESYIPSLISKRLEEKPLPNMEGTNFTVQLTIQGEKTLVYGFAVKDAREISVTPGGIANPMLDVVVPDDVIRPLVDMVASFTGRKQYDAASSSRGLLKLEVAMPGDWTLPVTVKFNGADSPSVTISAPAEVFAKMAAGEMSGPTAFMQGKIKMDGDMSFALSLTNLMP